jgi:hypothetical protein
MESLANNITDTTSVLPTATAISAVSVSGGERGGTSATSVSAKVNYISARKEFKEMKWPATVMNVNGTLTSDPTHSSIMTKIVLGQIKPPYDPIRLPQCEISTTTIGGDVVQVEIKEGEYMILGNRPDNEANYNSTKPEHLGKASMAAPGGHKFLVPTNMTNNFNWMFNAVTFIADVETIRNLQVMKQLALKYASAEWQITDHTRIGLYFHCYPANSIGHLHLHIVNLNKTGPSWHYQEFELKKNLPIDDVLDVLTSEMIYAKL